MKKGVLTSNGLGTKITTKAQRLKEPRRTARAFDRIYRIGKMGSFPWLP
jgi:hypothetical protein